MWLLDRFHDLILFVHHLRVPPHDVIPAFVRQPNWNAICRIDDEHKRPLYRFPLHGHLKNHPPKPLHLRRPDSMTFCSLCAVFLVTITELGMDLSRLGKPYW